MATKMEIDIPMDLNKIEDTLLKKFVKETSMARKSFLERLEEKYITNWTGENVVIDMRNPSIVEDNGSIAKMRPKEFGTLSSYTCPEGRKISKALKKIVIIRRKCRISGKVPKNSEIYEAISELAEFKSGEETMDKNSPRIQECYVSLHSMDMKGKSSINLKEISYKDLKRPVAKQQLSNKKYLSWSKSFDFNRDKTSRDPSEVSICDSSILELNDECKKRVKEGTMSFIHERAEAAQRLSKRKNPFNKSSDVNWYKKRQNLSTIPICDLSSRNLNKYERNKSSVMDTVNIFQSGTKASYSMPDKNKNLFKNMYENYKDLCLEIEDIQIMTESADGITNNFFGRKILQSSLYSPQFFKMFPKVNNLHVYSDKFKDKSTENERNSLWKKSSALPCNSNFVLPAVEYSGIRPLHCPSTPKQPFSLKI